MPKFGRKFINRTENVMEILEIASYIPAKGYGFAVTSDGSWVYFNARDFSGDRSKLLYGEKLFGEVKPPKPNTKYPDLKRFRIARLQDGFSPAAEVDRLIARDAAKALDSLGPQSEEK
jgi:hypothetical protein